ncbi:MAG: DUF4905 domain-containing protein [Bacteroidota bacterium]
MKNLQKNFSHVFNGKIWNIESEVNGDYLIIEVRDEDSFETSFFVYHPGSTEELSDPILLEESWWTGITHVAGQTILFHIFKDTENPEDKKYQAVNIRSSEVVWEISDISFTEYGLNFVKGIKDNRSITINIQNGNEANKKILTDTAKNNYLYYPFHYTPKSGHHHTVHSFLSSIGMNSDNSYGIDYFEMKDLVIISFYYKGKGLENRLIVLNQAREIMLDEILGTDLKGITDRSFFIYRDSLIFVQEHSDFFSYQLSQP